MAETGRTCPPVCMMAWRIHDLLDLEPQLDWIEAAGFNGAGFHAHAGVPGQWRGLDPASCPPSERRRWRRRLARFAVLEIHAPFALVLTTGTAAAVVGPLAEVLAFAGELGARVVTVHADPPALATAVWTDALGRLDGLAAEHGVVVGLEITAGFAALRDVALPNLGVTLDVGHMYHANRRPLQPYGSLGVLVREIGSALRHLHLHDVLAGRDHLETGTGEVDFAGLFAALQGTRYSGALTLELNPDVVSPDAMRRSLDWVRAHWQQRGDAG